MINLNETKAAISRCTTHNELTDLMQDVLDTTSLVHHQPCAYSGLADAATIAGMHKIAELCKAADRREAQLRGGLSSLPHL